MKIAVGTGGLENASKSNVAVQYGAANCPVTSVTSTHVQCEIPDLTESHNVNLDILTSAWDVLDVNVYQYDTIVLSWAFSLQTGTPTFKIQETDGNGNPANGGFETDPVTATLGQISMLVNLAPGTYSYTSGLVDGTFTEFKGTITVLPAKAWTLPVSMTVNGHAAAYDSFGRSSRKYKKKNKGDKHSETNDKHTKKSSAKIHKNQNKSKKLARNSCSETPSTSPITWPGLQVTVMDESVATKMSYTIHPEWTPEVTAIVAGSNNDYMVSMSPIPGDDCELNYDVIARSALDCMEQLEFDVVQVSLDSLNIAPLYSDPHAIGGAFSVDIIQSGRGAARMVNPDDHASISLHPIIDSVNLVDSNSNMLISPAGGSRLTMTGRGLASSRTIDLTSSVCNVVSNTGTEIVCITSPSNHGTVQNASYQLSDCKGGSTTFDLTSNFQLTTDSSLTLTIDTNAIIFDDVNGAGSIPMECFANCNDLLVDSQGGNYDFTMQQGNDTIAVTNVQFSLVGSTLTTTFDVSDYGPGAITMDFASHFPHGTIISSAGSQFATLFHKFEKSLPISSFDACYFDANCLTTGFSVDGGASVGVTFSDAIPTDLQISIMLNGNELCSDNCGLTWNDGDAEATFTIPASGVSDADSTATLGFAANGGTTVYSSLYNIRYRMAATPTTSGFTPIKANYAGGDAITITGAGFVDAEANMDGFERGKRKKKNNPFVYDPDATRTLACAHLAVRIGELEAIIDSCTATEIQARLPYTTAGSSAVTVMVESVGLAVASVVMNVNFVFSVSNIAPLTGSMGGGTYLTVTGTGSEL